MNTPVKSQPALEPFTAELYRYNRRKTREVMIGSVGVGGKNPIRVQSMTTTPTTDVDATVAQTIKLVEWGCEIVRITAPKMADARALGEIKKKLLAKGITVPLVADIHFNPECAMESANHVEKVRVNPGNYADFKAFKIIEYSDAQYAEELERIEERFTPLVLKCKELKRAMRIGCNHGSLSDRIMNRYGDTPEGMVEAALEFVRICRKNNYHELVLSMKSSNPKVMIEAYRLLALRMDEEGFDYPFHLGVTEAGYGEDGRIKSAIGIGSLLNDGIGDTIRVSLTEDPEHEVPVAFEIAKPYQPATKSEPKTAPRPLDTPPAATLPHVDNFYHYARRISQPLQIGPFKMGGEDLVRVVSDFTPWLKDQKTPKEKALKLLGLLEEQLHSGKDMVPEIIEFIVDTDAQLAELEACRKALGGETSRLAFLGRFSSLELAQKGLAWVHAATFRATDPSLDSNGRQQKLTEFIRMAKEKQVVVMIEAGSHSDGFFAATDHLFRRIGAAEQVGYDKIWLSLRVNNVPELIANVRQVVAQLKAKGKTYPIHLRWEGAGTLEQRRIESSIVFGSLLCDGIGDSVQIGPGVEPARELELVYNVLQGAGVRITKTEYVSCPSCGRTLFDLQTTTERIKQKTGHLKGVKIAIMGCIVNGPGEMADADFGYVGGAPDRINLYVGKECVEKGIPFEESDERLIQLIKAHGKWVDPK